MTHFKHLTSQDRYTIEAMLHSRHSQADVARALKVEPSTISKEIKRGGMTRATYRCARAPAPCRCISTAWPSLQVPQPLSGG
ncbi:MAG: helix-turn-helix domain-containing protein [Verrucomicrobiales bacterium]